MDYPHFDLLFIGGGIGLSLLWGFWAGWSTHRLIYGEPYKEDKKKKYW